MQCQLDPVSCTCPSAAKRINTHNHTHTITHTHTQNNACPVTFVTPLIPLCSRHNCMDYIQVLDGYNTRSKICDKSMRYSQETFRYNLTSSYATVRYFTTLGQMEGQSSRGFWLSYRQLRNTGYWCNRLLSLFGNLSG